MNRINIDTNIEFVFAILFLNVILLFKERGLLVQIYIVIQNPSAEEVNASKKELYELIIKLSRLKL